MKYVSVQLGEDGGFVLDAEPYITVLPTLKDDLPPGAWAFVGEQSHYRLGVTPSRAMKGMRLSAVEFGSNPAGTITASYTAGPRQLDNLTILYREVFLFESTLKADRHIAQMGESMLDEVLPVLGGCSHEVALIGGNLTICCRDLHAEWTPRGRAAR